MSKIKTYEVKYNAPALDQSGKPKYDSKRQFIEGAFNRLIDCDMYLIVADKVSGPFPVRRNAKTNAAEVSQTEGNNLISGAKFSAVFTRQSEKVFNDVFNRNKSLVKNISTPVILSSANNPVITLPGSLSVWRMAAETVEANSRRKFIQTVSDFVSIYNSPDSDEASRLMKAHRYVTLPDYTIQGAIVKNTNIIIDMHVFLHGLYAIMNSGQWEKPLLDILSNPPSSGTGNAVLSAEARWEKAVHAKGGEFICFSLFSAYTYFQLYIKEKLVKKSIEDISPSLSITSFLNHVNRMKETVEQTAIYLSRSDTPMGKDISDSLILLTRSLVLNAVLLSPVTVNSDDNGYWNKIDSSTKKVFSTWEDDAIMNYILRRAAGEKIKFRHDSDTFLPDLDLGDPGYHFPVFIVMDMTLSKKTYPLPPGASSVNGKTTYTIFPHNQPAAKLKHFSDAKEYRDSSGKLIEDSVTYIDIVLLYDNKSTMPPYIKTDRKIRRVYDSTGERVRTVEVRFLDGTLEYTEKHIVDPSSGRIMIDLKQFDHQWTGLGMNNHSEWHIGTWGCYITSIANIVNYYYPTNKLQTTPVVVDLFASSETDGNNCYEENNNSLSPEGIVKIWQKYSMVQVNDSWISGRKLSGARGDQISLADFKNRMNKNIFDNCPTIIRYALKPLLNVTAGSTHFLVLTGARYNNNNEVICYILNDPVTVNAQARYLPNDTTFDAPARWSGYRVTKIARIEKGAAE